MAKKIILSQEEIQNLINLYNEGNSLRTISKITGYSRNFITKVFNENNFIRRTNKVNSRKYYLNDNYFEIIDSAEKAYWVGFIAADGYISKRESGSSNRLGITLSEKDIEHLYKFNKCLNSTYERRNILIVCVCLTELLSRVSYRCIHVAKQAVFPPFLT